MTTTMLQGINLILTIINCSKRAKTLCAECDVCIGRSVASHPKSDQYSSQNEIDSKFVTRGNNKKFMWDCVDCPHTFPSPPSRFLKAKTGKSNGCSYCGNKLLCPKEKNCQICFNKSFASSDRAKNVVDKSIDLTQVFLNSHDECEFWCDQCPHSFPATYSYVSQGGWCKYCANRKLCPKEKNCQLCFNKSFAFSDRAQNVIDKSIDLTQIFLNNMEECEFWCECGHDFPSTYSEVSQGYWCQFCCNPPKLLCPKEKNCIKCFNKSFASSKRAHNVVDKTIDLYKVFKNSNKKCQFKCDKGHSPWITKYGHISNGSWCPECFNKTEQIIGEFFEEEYENPVEYQAKFDSLRSDKGSMLKFDFIFHKEKCIVEPDGGHHFKKVARFKNDPEVVRATDVKKMKWALENGYSMVRICQEDVWNDKPDWDWRAKLKEHIKYYKTPQIIWLAKDLHLYDKHKADML